MLVWKLSYERGDPVDERRWCNISCSANDIRIILGSELSICYQLHIEIVCELES